ncbi:PepSY domain-containing protein [Amycolatopsis sp. NBC_00345]|uniref:PepSY-associated TM helix domain-containing protein n=1 Tax=Amycolatopsis sp. NBC_00345 TaxID=2975955 RepID=UPI002E266DD7
MSTRSAEHRSRGQDPGTTGRRRAPRPNSALQLLARRVHFLAGILVAPFLMVLCLTGLVYVFSPQIHDSLYHSDLHVSRAVGPAHPVSDQVRAALRAHPECTLKSIITAPAPDRTTRVVLSVRGAAGDRTVFVDPYTNYINGELSTVNNRLPANTWLRDLHSNLQLGPVGRVYAELAASWLPLLVVGGLILWFARTRRKRRLREVLLPVPEGKKGWLRLRSVHGALGLWLAAGLLVAGVTGLSMSQFAGGRGDQTVDPVHLRAPALVAAPVRVLPGVQPIGLDEALDVAESAGLTGELTVTPAHGATPFTAAETSEGLPMQRDSITIDPYTARVTERIGWRDYSPLAKLSVLGAEFHTGTLFGLANQILLALVAAATLVLIGLGYRMWWIHNPYRPRWSSLPRPVWRQVPRPVLLAVVLGVAAIGWVLPVFAVSLVLFVIFDAVLAGLTRKRKREPAAPRPRQG